MDPPREVLAGVGLEVGEMWPVAFAVEESPQVRLGVEVWQLRLLLRACFQLS